ncbi:hypothetical protein JG687_00008517, partial [Phytophthora cactorum]
AKGGLVEALTKIDAARADTVQDILAELKRRAIGAGTIALPSCIVTLLWMCGNKAKQYPPFRHLVGHDMPNRKMQKRLSQLRYVTSKVESASTSKDLLQLCQSDPDVRWP